MEGAVIIDGRPPAVTGTNNGNGNRNLVLNHMNFKRSGEPSRVMFYSNGGWKDFPEQLVIVFANCFGEKRTSVEMVMDGCDYIVDFLRMALVDLSTGFERSVAWIDVSGQCFFPGVVVGDENSFCCGQLDAKVGSKRVERSMSSSGPFEEHSDENSVTTDGNREKRQRWSGVGAVDCEDRYYKAVESFFVSWMRSFDPNVEVTGIGKWAFAGSPGGEARRTAFWAMAEATRVVRGDANIRLGWYSASVEDLAGVLKHGFTRANDGVLGSEAHGVGVHLARSESLHTISVLPKANENGERHFMLCRAITGAVEKVERGSQQSQPSSDKFDSGVDDMLNPKWYVMWSSHMNTHIIPECVVTFRCSNQRVGVKKPTYVNISKPTTNWNHLTFSQLFAEIEKSLPPSATKTLNMFFDRYKAKKLRKDVFIRQLRSIAGNNLLIEAIRKIRERL